MMWRYLSVLCLLWLVSAAEEARPQYTQSLETFKNDKHKARLQLLVGCWLMSREHLPSATSYQQLILVKSCLKHITRKDSVVKITAIIGKNMTRPKTYSQVVLQIPDINQPKSQNKEFDDYLLGLLKGYEKDLIAVREGEGESIKQRIEQQMQKRQKYYFGIIPANQWTHFLFLISISLMLVMVCTCYKYFQMRKLKMEANKKGGDRENKEKEFFKQASAFTKGKSAPNKKKSA